MKTIIINQKNSDSVVLMDDDSKDLILYTKEVSKILELSKICILETTSGSIILKPSEINSIVINELPELKKEKQKNPKPEEKQEVKKEDVIKD